MRYFITFSCYGAHLHGDELGSVDRNQNVPGSRLLAADAQRLTAELEAMKNLPYLLDRDSQAFVLQAIREACLHRGWNLLAAHVRTNHLHVVVAERKRWARHGSTRWLWKDEDVRDAIRYVVEEQGEPMAVFVNDML